MCFINTKTNGCLGRWKDVACILVLGGVGVGQMYPLVPRKGGGGRRNGGEGRGQEKPVL